MHQDFYAEYFRIEDTHWWFLGRREIFLRLLRKYLPRAHDEHPRRILDVGCGTGTMLRQLSRFGQAQGIDADAEAIAFCHDRGITQVRRVGGLPLPFAADAFDVITALDVIEHIEDDRAMLRELYRIIRPGGLFLFSVPAYPFLWGAQDEISHHKRRYVASQLRARAVEAGFRVARLSYMNTLLFPAIAAIRLVRAWRRRPIEVTSDFALTRPGLANDLLARLFALEAPMVERVNLPFGTSIVGVAFK